MKQRQWSYSSISNYEKCPHRYFLAKIEGHPDEAGAAAKRGTRIHEAIEKYLNHEEDELPEVVFNSFGGELANAREAGAEAELEFAYDDEWNPISWDDAWVRGKVDLVMRDKSLIVDFKTGKYYSNHREQASLYALAMMIGEVTEDAEIEFWYIDLDDTMGWEFKRKDLAGLKEMWEYRANRLEEETNWEPRPSPLCKWCSFSAKKGGQCPAG
jgi:CRISPR/Cas system-associated exonuclease Cas4 (RecB family)